MVALACKCQVQQAFAFSNACLLCMCACYTVADTTSHYILHDFVSAIDCQQDTGSNSHVPEAYPFSKRSTSSAVAVNLNLPESMLCLLNMHYTPEQRHQAWSVHANLAHAA